MSSVPGSGGRRRIGDDGGKVRIVREVIAEDGGIDKPVAQEIGQARLRRGLFDPGRIDVLGHMRPLLRQPSNPVGRYAIVVLQDTTQPYSGGLGVGAYPDAAR